MRVLCKMFVRAFLTGALSSEDREGRDVTSSMPGSEPEQTAFSCSPVACHSSTWPCQGQCWEVMADELYKWGCGGGGGSQLLSAGSEGQKSEHTAQEPQQRALQGVEPALELVAEVFLRFLFSFFPL